MRISRSDRILGTSSATSQMVKLLAGGSAVGARHEASRRFLPATRLPSVSVDLQISSSMAPHPSTLAVKNSRLSLNCEAMLSKSKGRQIAGLPHYSVRTTRTDQPADQATVSRMDAAVT